jgi:hypothetical protein
MNADRTDDLVDSLIVEIELLGASYSPRDLIVGLLAAAVEVAETSGVPLDFVTRMAGRVVAYGFDA